MTMSLEGGWRVPLSIALGCTVGVGGGRGWGGLSDYFLSLAFGGKLFHILEHFLPN